MRELFRVQYEERAELLLDILQQAMTTMPMITAFRPGDHGDQIEFETSFTWTSWGEKMVATVQSDNGGGAILAVSGKPRVGLASTPWGEELHAATIETQLRATMAPLLESARTNPVLMLQADHRYVEALFLRIRTAAGDQRAAFVRQLLHSLHLHMQLEERHVYPLLRQEADADLAEQAEVEHQLARAALQQLEQLAPDGPGFDAALTMVMAGIEHHVVEEETQALPRLMAQLGPDRLAVLAQQLTAARSDLLDESGEVRHGPPKRKGRRAPAARPARPKRPAERTRTPRSRRTASRVDPDQTTRADLIARARQAGISGYSHLSKEELAKALNRAG